MVDPAALIDLFRQVHLSHGPSPTPAQALWLTDALLLFVMLVCIMVPCTVRSGCIRSWILRCGEHAQVPESALLCYATSVQHGYTTSGDVPCPAVVARTHHSCTLLIPGPVACRGATTQHCAFAIRFRAVQFGHGIQQVPINELHPYTMSSASGPIPPSLVADPCTGYQQLMQTSSLRTLGSDPTIVEALSYNPSPASQ
jgi:hypothetical protein